MPAGRHASWRTVGWLLAAGAMALPGCSDLPVQIGHEAPRDRDRKGHVGTIGESEPGKAPPAPAGTDPLDPRQEQAVGVYRQAYLFWNAEQKQLEDNVAGNTLAFTGAYTRILSHLTRMSQLLVPEKKEKLESYIGQYKSMAGLVSTGNRGRLVERQAMALGNHIRAEFEPGTVDIVPTVAAGPEPPEAIANGESGAEPAGANGADAPAPAGNPRAPATYVGAYADWRAHHKTLLDSLFSEEPKIDEHYKNAMDALARMRTDLPPADRERLQMFMNEYERTAKAFLEGATARRTINQFRMIATEIEKNFAPEAVPFP